MTPDNEVAIFGATGYTGQECLRILSNHPFFRIVAATSSSTEGMKVHETTPLRNFQILTSTNRAIEDIKPDSFALLCLPHGESEKIASQLLKRKVKVIDLSADFRLEAFSDIRDANSTPLYGLCELNSPEISRQVRLVANPGCYPTSILLPLIPLFRSGLIRTKNIIIDSKSGSSGAGRSHKNHLLLAELTGNFMAYSPGRSHRHIPEMERFIEMYSGQSTKLTFTPHLLPVSRGLFSTIYAEVESAQIGTEQLIQTLKSAYANHPFVWVFENGLPNLNHVVNTNRCAMGLVVQDQQLILVSAIDNLVKGAAGQAIQNLNRMAGLPDATGLEHLV